MTLQHNNRQSRSVHGQFQNLQGPNGLNHYPRPVTTKADCSLGCSPQCKVQLIRTYMVHGSRVHHPPGSHHCINGNLNVIIIICDLRYCSYSRYDVCVDHLARGLCWHCLNLLNLLLCILFHFLTFISFVPGLLTVVAFVSRLVGFLFDQSDFV